MALPDLSTRFAGGAPEPLSAAQAHAWFLAQLMPGSAADHRAIALRIRGPLALSRLERSLERVVNRHDALRTFFVTGMGRPQRYTAAHVPLPLPPVDLPGAHPENVQPLLVSWVEAPFTLDEEPLIRGHLLRIAPDHHVLLLVGHALVVDSHSLQLLVAELAAHYNDRGPAPTPPDPFASYERRQAAELQTEAGRAARRYWAHKLAHSQPLLDLPTDNPRPPMPTLRAGSHRLDLRSSAPTQGHSDPHLLWLAAWFILLYRYTGQEDLVLGVAGFYRGAEERGVIGPCDSNLVLRVRVTGGQSGEQLLGALRTALEEAQQHPLHFAELVAQVHPVRELSHAPLFQLLFSWQQLPPAPRFGEAASDWLQPPVTSTRYDLTLSLTRYDGRTTGDLIFNADLFTPATVAGMAGHYQRLLSALRADSECSIAQLPMLSREQRNTLLACWNDTTVTYPEARCLHHYFERQVERTPDGVALYVNDRAWRYRELNERANRLARYLVGRGVRPGDLVAVCLERSAELVIALLAILKAGAAYVPLDPAYPPERSIHILENARVALLLSQTALLPQLPGGAWVCICLDQVTDEIGSHPSDNPAVPLSASSLAYAIYTSGSTGRPKGVEISHRSVSAFVSWACMQYSPAELRVVLAATSVCFDLSIFELFVPLSCGGTVMLVKTILELVDGALPLEITLVNTVPSAATELVEAGALPPSVLTVNLAGEAFRQRLAHQLYAHGVGRVYNLYGPSEYTTYATCALLAPDGAAEGRPPIGRPIANTRVYLLDDHQQPVPVGVIGELYIGGAGLARGYRGRPDLTQRAFVANPFHAGQRLYRTGDLARYRSDGQLVFVGRKDHQIKLRGYRIELGEIETVLEAHPAVREVAVVLCQQAPHPPLLVAALVTEEERAADIGTEMRRFLAQKLPNYMIPSHFHLLPALPRTPNGKIDRQRLAALPPPTTGQGERIDGAIEARLVQIWQEVLGIQGIGATDDFFELGGNSLLAVRLMARIEQEFGRKLPLSTLF